jgi:hypothetical protein
VALTTENCLPELRRMPTGAGFDEADPNLAVLWSVLKEWVALPVEGIDPDVDADMLLFEASLDCAKGAQTHSARRSCSASRASSASRTRRASTQGWRSSGRSSDTPCTRTFRAITQMQHENFGTADQFWGSGGPRAEEWTRRVETSRSYQVALEHRPLKVELYHSPV